MGGPDPKTLTTTITYLEMTERPSTPTPPRPAQKIALMRAEEPTPRFYRFLYDTVGEDWLWYERRVLKEDDLSAIIQDPLVEVYVLYVAGGTAGFGELDRRGEGEIELAYFGLMPEFIGIGVGGYFLRWLVDQAWTYEPPRLWVHTCDLDHPRALQVYQGAGFIPYKRETVEFQDPRESGQFADWHDPRPENVTGEVVAFSDVASIDNEQT